MRGWRASRRAATMRSSSGASPRVFLSGLPGVTSHQTRSRSSRFIANRLAPRWAPWAGSNVPPKRPIRIPGVCVGRRTRGIGIARPASRGSACTRERGATAGATGGFSRSDLPRSVHTVLEGGELLDADWAAGVEAAGGDADLGAEAELAAVGALGRGIVQDDRGIDFAQKFSPGRIILSHDRVGVGGAVALDMRDRRVDAVDHLGGDDGVEIFRRPVRLARRLDARVDGPRRLVAAHLAAGV